MGAACQGARKARHRGAAGFGGRPQRPKFRLIRNPFYLLGEKGVDADVATGNCVGSDCIARPVSGHHWVPCRSVRVSEAALVGGLVVTRLAGSALERWPLFSGYCDTRTNECPETMASDPPSCRASLSRSWTAEEDVSLLELYRQGKRLLQIAARLRRTVSSVLSRKGKLGMRRGTPGG